MDVRKSEPKSQQLKDKNYSIARFVSIAVVILGLIMGLICLKSKNMVQTVYCASYTLLFAIVTFVIIKTKKIKIFCVAVEIFFTFTTFFYLKNGGSQGFGLVWILLIPFLSVYLFDSVDYYFFNGIVLLILILGLWTPLYKYAYDIGNAFRIRIPIVFIMEAIFGVFLRYRIEKTEKDLENQKNILAEEIKNAALIQQSFLPKSQKNYKDWDVATKNVPMIGVSGDLYCIFDKNKKLEGIGLFDISGHGISSGLLTMIAKNTIEQQFYENLTAKNGEELWKTVDKVNDKFIAEKGEVPNYLTGILVKISDENNLEIVNAGHQEPIIYRKETNSFETLKKDKSSVGAIGISDFPTFYLSQYLKMQSGDELFLFTDGLIDSENEDGENFGQKRFLESLKKHINLLPKQQTENVIQDIENFRGKKVNDDLTLMILKKN